MTLFIGDAPVNPPWVDEKHFAECEDRRFWHCPECKALTHDVWLNICDWCGDKFIPRVVECICDEIKVNPSYYVPRMWGDELEYEAPYPT